MLLKTELEQLVLGGYVHPTSLPHHYGLTEKGRAMRRALATVDAAARAGTPIHPKAG